MVDAGFRKFRPDLVVIERAHIVANTSGAPLIELGGAVKQALWRHQAPFHVLPATSLKAFAGSGRLSKGEMIAAAQKLWPACPDNDDIADAFFLALYGYEKYDEIVSPS